MSECNFTLKQNCTKTILELHLLCFEITNLRYLNMKQLEVWGLDACDPDACVYDAHIFDP